MSFQKTMTIMFSPACCETAPKWVIFGSRHIVSCPVTLIFWCKEDIADMVGLPVDPQAGWVTGQNILVNGFAA